MANFNIPENPEYTDQVRMFETDDPGHADVFNPVIEHLVHNDAFFKLWQEAAKRHIEDKNNPHKTTAAQIGLGNVDNTADIDKPVSDPVQAALDSLYKQLTGYTDTEIANLIGGAPTTLDTLGEIAKAMQDNNTVVEALNQAIGKKANAAEFDSHEADTTKHITATERTKWDAKLDATGDAANTIVTFTSADVENPTAWTAMALFTAKEKLSSFFNKISIMAKNVRYLYKMLGTTDISSMGDGTVTGALSQLNSKFTNLFANGFVNDPDAATTPFATVNGWDSQLKNVPPDFSACMGILITVFVFNSSIGLPAQSEVACAQALIYNGKVKIRASFGGTKFGDWV